MWPFGSAQGRGSKRRSLCLILGRARVCAPAPGFPLPFRWAWPLGPWNGNWVLRMANKLEGAWDRGDIMPELDRSPRTLFMEERWPLSCLIIIWGFLLLQDEPSSDWYTLPSGASFHLLRPRVRKGEVKKRAAGLSATLTDVPPRGSER